jgi:hypothetical protein
MTARGATPPFTARQGLGPPPVHGQMPDVQPVKAIYYPHIQFESLGWLKAALLYWEGILRIVPDGFEPFDPPEVHELATAGLISSISPSRYLESVRRLFAARLDELLATHLGHSWGLDRESGALIHIAEIEPGLLQALQARGLAAAAGEWASMSPELATLYKITLATEAGLELHAAPSTEEAKCDAPFVAARKVMRESGIVGLVDGFACARLLDPFPSIECRALSIPNLLEIRRTLVSQRRAFREQVQARAAAIDALPSAAGIQSHLNDLTAEIQAEASARRRYLRASNVRNAFKIVSVSAPAALGAAVTMAGAPLPVAAVGVLGSVGLGVADWFSQRRTGRREAGHYLISLEAAVRRLSSLRRNGSSASFG